MADLSAYLYSTLAAGMNLYMAEKIITVTAAAITHPKRELIASDTPIHFGKRSRMCEYTMVPEYRMRMTKGERMSITMSTPRLLKKGRSGLRTPQTLNTFSTRSIIQMTSQMNIRALMSPNMSFVAEMMILSAASIRVPMSSLPTSRERSIDFSLSPSPKPPVMANATAMKGTKAIAQK